MLDNGSILENLSKWKLLILIGSLLLCQVFSFLLGGLFAPPPSGHQNILGITCLDNEAERNNANFLLYARNEGACQLLTSEQEHTKKSNQLVHIFQMPLPRDNRVLEYSRWQQQLIGVLQLDIAFNRTLLQPPKQLKLTIDARLAYGDVGDAAHDWKLLAHSLELRYVDCDASYINREEALYSCDMVHLFQLSSLHHSYYLLNLRLPFYVAESYMGHMHDVTLTSIHQNGGFTKIWLLHKTLLLPVVLATLIWFWQRVHMLQRSPALLEHMLIYLGVSLTGLNLPLEYLSLYIEAPYLPLLNDLRLGIFFAMLLSFWLVFAGEHMLIQHAPDKCTIRSRYWKHLFAVALCSIALCIFDICERVVQLRNPFDSMWNTIQGYKVAIGLLLLAAVSAIIYLLFLSYMLWKVFSCMDATMSQKQRLQLDALKYRIKFLMMATLICAMLTLGGFKLSRMAEYQLTWYDNRSIELDSAFLIGIYGMWNIYTIALLILYAPSHKQSPSNLIIQTDYST